ncbi:precorrin-8X methylmutase [Sulfobacillus sp. hq2]|uniref:precorrin-8X methylmutase n=1 Tax=Sulfobacillus TaxID=28033 RepID=UPI000CD04F76|nr:precorrin-8X methylmutase [Sulfobacillus sp. hq2]POB12260.1 precorrin-8X methylmutase [Sulfobacillus sp. hq2]
MRATDIYRASFALIRQQLSDFPGTLRERDVVERIIHATADWDFAHVMRFHPEAVDQALKTLLGQGSVIVDVRMALAGMDHMRMAKLGVQTACYIDDVEVTKEAARTSVTRAALGIRKAVHDNRGDAPIVVVANAPTALFEALEWVNQGWRPAVIIGVPVGFIMAQESKEALIDNGRVPYIANPTPKGGSPVAAAIMNALLRMATGESPW